jgi:rRNA-processing protein FCF1
MRIILDSNEYILGLDTAAGPNSSSRLLDLVRILIDESEEFRLLVPEIIVREVQRNLPTHSSRKIEYHTPVDVPKATLQKYQQQSRLKHADALIAAFADTMKVDYIVSENRHIYRHLKASGFATLTAQGFLELVEE